MSSSKITTIGFYNWMQSQNDDLFSKLCVPEGINKDTLIDNILMRAGEFEVVYSNPFFFQNAIGAWSDKHHRTFEKWIDALSIEYNPVENYDRMEEWEDKSNGNSIGETKGTTSLNSINENRVSAFDSDFYQPDSYNSNTSNGNDESNTKTNSINNSEHVGHVHGNIGVTTTQQMLESELSLAEWNVYEHITDLFIEEFCISIYW